MAMYDDGNSGMACRRADYIVSGSFEVECFGAPARPSNSPARRAEFRFRTHFDTKEVSLAGRAHVRRGTDHASVGPDHFRTEIRT